MKQTRLVILILVVVLFGSLSLVGAQDDGNACENGGDMAGKCDNEWKWICGWYLQHWEDAGGWYSNYAFPDWCDPASLLPPKPEVTNNLAGCYSYISGPVLRAVRIGSIYYNGTSGSNYTSFTTPDCSGTGYPSSKEYIVESSNSSSAQAMCSTLVNPLYAYVTTLNSRGYASAPSSLWFCYET
ncbi:MAG: hypothetical protein R3E39_08450 [Anaerolineae bacterium]